MRLFVSILFIGFSFFTVVTASAEEQVTRFSTEYLFDEKKDFNSRELIVKFKPTVTDSQKSSLLQTLKVKEISRLDKRGFSLLTVSKEEDLLSLADELLVKSEVEFAEPNYKISSTYVPKDPGAQNQWHLEKVGLHQAWDVTRGAEEITVAVVDSGVQTDHPDLKGKIIHPYDVITGNSKIKGDFHGTHVAGIIVSSHNNGGTAGIAPNIKIMPINVFEGDSASVYDLVTGIYYATEHRANLINLSLGSPSYSQALSNAIQYARSKGVTVIAAAGNESTYLRSYPAAIKGVIGVSATNVEDEIAGFSNFGDYIDLAAPGENIYSTINGSSYQYSDGTSMAAPIVTGVSALLLSKNPFLTPDEIESILTRSAIDLGTQGRDSYYGAGRIDAYRALKITPAPVSSLKVLQSSFRIEGTNKTEMTIDIYKGTKVSAEIRNSNNAVVRELLVNKVWNGGKLTLSWNGKLDNGQYAPTGTYKVYMKIANSLENMSKSAELKVENAVNPVVKIKSKSSVFSPSKSKQLVIPYSLNKNARITAVIYNSHNKKIKTLATNKTVIKGNRSVTWTGKDNKGKKVPDGKYKLVIYAVDYQNRKSNAKRMDIKVDTVKPKATAALSSTIYRMDGKSKAKLKLKVKESVYIDAYITTKKGKKIKKVASHKKYSASTHTLVWDGKNMKKKYAAEGKYIFLVEISDKAGNKRVVKSPIFAMQDWRKPEVEGQSLIEYRNTVVTTQTYKLNKPGYIKVEVFKDNALIRTVQPKVWKKAGTHSFKWDGKNKSGRQLKDGKYQYKITITDAYKQRANFSGNIIISLARSDRGN